MIRATKEDKNLVVDILLEAFEPLKEDNSINFVVKQDKKRKQRMRVLMEYLFDKAQRTGAVFLSDNRASCLLITYAHKDRFTLSKALSTLRLVVKCIGITRVRKVLKRQAVIQRNYPDGKYIRPMIFAVKDEYRGTITAAKLIMEVFKDFQDNQLPIIVDTASKDLVKLYQKFGLKIFNTEQELGFPIYLLKMHTPPNMQMQH